MIFAKILQLIGMAELLLALYCGVFLKAMNLSMIFLLLGIIFFLLGWAIERRAAR